MPKRDRKVLEAPDWFKITKSVWMYFVFVGKTGYYECKIHSLSGEERLAFRRQKHISGDGNNVHATSIDVFLFGKAGF